MNIDENCFIQGASLLIISPNAKGLRGKIIANYGTYLIVEPETTAEIKPGEQVSVEVSRSGGTLIFESYICFMDDANSAHFCIYLSPDLCQKERRKYLRLGIELKLTYQVEEKTVHTRTINISAGGAYFFTPERLDVGQDILISIDLPEGEVTLPAKVVRTMQNAASVEFSDRGDAVDLLASFLYRLCFIKDMAENSTCKNE